MTYRAYMPLGDECPRPEAIYYRALPDGLEITVYRMLFNHRVCFGEQGEWGGVIDAYCYPTPDRAIMAATLWNGEGEPLVGWTKHVMSHRYRPNGDPAREYDQRRPEPQHDHRDP
jgi:hypothetical protein